MMGPMNKEYTLDVLQHVIHQMCFEGECPFYKECQDVGEGPWSSNDQLYNPLQLSKCVKNGFKHTVAFSGPDEGVCGWCGEVNEDVKIHDAKDNLGPYFFCKCGQMNYLLPGE